ncbi:MAG: alpha/beta hydrolase [Patescibacteria group bacterium]
MKNAIIIHGRPDKEEYYDSTGPSSSNYAWIPWLQKQLLLHEIIAQAPEIPHAYEPDYPTWKKEFERYDMTPETILVGHSCGGGFLIRWLSEHPEVTVGKVVLVAPWLDPERKSTTDFFDFEIDSKIANRTKNFIVFYSDNDTIIGVQKTIMILKEKVKAAQFRKFHLGHFCIEDMPKGTFPELLEVLLVDIS